MVHDEQLLASQRTQQSRTDASTVTYTYDNIGQLKSAIGSGGQSTENLGYLYDTAWNLNKRTNNGTPTTFAVDVKNQLTSVGGLSCSYDNNGNLTTRVPVSMCYIYYTYDDENQLTRVATDTSGTPTGSRWRSDFTYDGRGRLRKRADYTWYTGGGGSWYPAGEVRYVYDGMRVIQERNSGNTPTVAYTRGNDLSGSREGAGGIGGMLARSVYSGGAWGSHNSYHADGNGNITALVDSSQAVSAGYRYNPYGQVIGLSGGSMTNQNVYRFSSKEVHSNSGLYYYGYRFYDPNLQRWLNRDPVKERGGINLYRFCANGPTSAIDPLGLGYGNPVPPCAPYPECLSFPPPPSPFQIARDWIRKCHPELDCGPYLQVPLPFGATGLSLGVITIIVPGQPTEDIVDSIAHEGMHCILGPRWGRAHDEIYDSADWIRREYVADPTGARCRCKGTHPGAPPARYISAPRDGGPVLVAPGTGVIWY
jgi:RHS repeat-associated protein